MKDTVYIYMERYDCTEQIALYPYMEYESTMRICKNIYRNAIARVVEIKINGQYHSPDHHMQELMGF